MINKKRTAGLGAMSTATGVLDGGIAAGIAGAVGGPALAAFMVVGGIAFVVTGFAYAMCMAAGDAERASGC